MGDAAGVTRDAVAAYERDGVVVLRGAFARWVEPLRAGVARNMAAPGPNVRIYQGEGGTGRFFGDYCNWSRIPEYRDFIMDSPAARIAARLMGASTVRIFHEHVLVKEPGADVTTPWHHDQPYYCVNGRQNCSLWTPLDPVPEETCPEYVKGSHRWGRWFSPSRFNRQPLYRDDGFEPVPDIDAARDAYDIARWALDPGDAIAFDFLTLHGAPPNRSRERSRRAVSTRWIGDDATFAVRRGETSPPFPGLTLTHGDPMDAPEFPVVYREGS